jgi:phosphoserine aminotransferase
MSSSEKTATAGRVFNFSAGPSVLPVPVLEEAQRDLLNYKGAGMSVLEMSHRSKVYDAIIKTAIADMREVLAIPENYHVLFLQGGASLQFSMVPMNFLPAGGSADYIVTGAWSQAAVKEAKKVGGVNIAASTEDEHFTRIPRQDELKLDASAAYVHFTSNNTIFGTEFKEEPEVGDAPLVCDASSDILSRPIDVAKYGVIYAGAQKNMGPAGVTMAIVRDDLLARIPPGLPTMLDYGVHVKKESLYNTPPTFAIYMVGLVLKWLKSLGGLAEMQRVNETKANMLYDAIDGTDFYRGTAEKASRSLMNVTFRLPNEDLEKKFVAEATAAGLDGLKGHRSVGGLRASIYNAFPTEGVRALVDFMKEFERVNG